MKKFFVVTILFSLLGGPTFLHAGGVSGLLDGVFSDAGLGFRYPLPTGLSDETSFARETLQKRAAALHTTNIFDVLLRMTSGPDDTAPEWRAVSIQTYPRSNFAERGDAAAEEKMNTLAAGAEAKAIGGSERVSVAGTNFVASNFEQSEPLVVKHARVCSTVRNGKVLSFAFTANSTAQLELLAGSLQALVFAGASPSSTYLGFDRNDYPGDQNLANLRVTFSYSSYWLNNPPGSNSNSWAGKRRTLEAAGFGFAVLFNGRLYKELGSVGRATEMGSADARGAVQAAGREGFPAHTIIFLDQEEGGRLLPEQKAYLFAWVDGIRQAGFRPGVYCSGIPAKEAGGASVVSAEDIRANAGAREITYWVTNDACPPSPGCSVSQRPKPGSSGVSFADMWQFAQSPLRKRVASGCVGSYSADGNCYAPGVSAGLHLDLNTADSADPSQGRTGER